MVKNDQSIYRPEALASRYAESISKQWSPVPRVYLMLLTLLVLSAAIVLYVQRYRVGIYKSENGFVANELPRNEALRAGQKVLVLVPGDLGDLPFKVGMTVHLSSADGGTLIPAVLDSVTKKDLHEGVSHIPETYFVARLKRDAGRNDVLERNGVVSIRYLAGSQSLGSLILKRK